MQRRIARAATGLAAAALLVAAAPAAAQHGGHGERGAHGAAMPTSGFRAELIRDIEQLEQKYLGLADAMVGKYEWRPGEGVRSVSEVFMHVAGANFLIPIAVGHQPPKQYRGADQRETMSKLMALEQITDPERVKAELRHAFMHAKHTIAGVQDGELDDTVRLFGQDYTKRAALHLLVTHMHEHLGQAIAYARTNGVVPPWSAGTED
mgnify:CR=1 FL=1